MPHSLILLPLLSSSSLPYSVPRTHKPSSPPPHFNGKHALFKVFVLIASFSRMSCSWSGFLTLSRSLLYVTFPENPNLPSPKMSGSTLLLCTTLSLPCFIFLHHIYHYLISLLLYFFVCFLRPLPLISYSPVNLTKLVSENALEPVCPSQMHVLAFLKRQQEGPMASCSLCTRLAVEISLPVCRGELQAEGPMG